MSSRGVLASQLVSLDFSEVLIAKMRAKHGTACGTWMTGDITQLASSFPPSSFDLVIDKFTVDALTVDPEDPWWYVF